MSLILVSGIATSGKSSVARALQDRGFTAYDTEHAGRSAWFNSQTGERAAEFGKMPERTAEWLSQHEWLISLTWVSEVAERAAHNPIFICGGAANESKVWPFCAHLIWLKTDENTIGTRLGHKRDHDYGTRPHELTLIMQANAIKEAEYRQVGATIIDATQPIKTVIKDILAAINI